MDFNGRKSLFCILPVELVEYVACLLDAEDVLSLRLACGDLYRTTFNYFRRRFFTVIRTDLSRESLRKIDALSQHKELRAHVQHLALMRGNGVGQGFVWERHPWGSLAAPLQLPGIQTLRDNLLHNLVNCRSFYIFCRFSEGHQGPEITTVSDAVAILLAVVVDAQLPLKSFHLRYVNRHSRNLMMDMRRLPKMIHGTAEFRMAWKHIKELSLEQYLTLDNFGFLMELILNAPNLQTLSLNLGCHDIACEFINELSCIENLPPLQELRLSHTMLRLEDILSLLCRLRGSLSVLTLDHVTAASGCTWVSLMKQLGNGFLSLRAITLYFLAIGVPTRKFVTFRDLKEQIYAPGSEADRFILVYPDNGEKSTVMGVTYKGPGMDQALRQLERSVEYAQTSPQS